MDEFKLDKLLENDREWRRYLIERVEKISDTQNTMHAWNLVFRIIGGGLFALLLVLIEVKLN